MKGLITILVVILLVGCSASKRYARLILNHPELIQRTDSVITWVESRCDSAIVYVPYQDITFDTSGVVPVSVVFHKAIRKNNLSGTVDISNGKLTFNCAEDSLREVIEYMTKEYHEKDSRVSVQTIPLRDSWYQFWRDGFWICLFLLCLVIAGLFIKK